MMKSAHVIRLDSDHSNPQGGSSETYTELYIKENYYYTIVIRKNDGSEITPDIFYTIMEDNINFHSPNVYMDKIKERTRFDAVYGIEFGYLQKESIVRRIYDAAERTLSDAQGSISVLIEIKMEVGEVLFRFAEMGQVNKNWSLCNTCISVVSEIGGSSKSFGGETAFCLIFERSCEKRGLFFFSLTTRSFAGSAQHKVKLRWATHEKHDY